MEREGKADGSNFKHLHDLNGSNACAIPKRVTAMLGAGIVGDMGDGDLARVDRGVDKEGDGGVNEEGDGVTEAIDGATEEVEADKNVTYIFLYVWLVRKCRKPRNI